jgi:DNA-binding transcriptional ArsR family regulator
MVVDDLTEVQVDLIFHALADGTRRDIVARVLQGEDSVSALAARYPMSFAAVQKHVAVLERAGLVGKRRQGRLQLVRGNADTLQRARELLERYEHLWQGRAERMAAILDDRQPTERAES